MVVVLVVGFCGGGKFQSAPESNIPEFHLLGPDIQILNTYPSLTEMAAGGWGIFQSIPECNIPGSHLLDHKEVRHNDRNRCLELDDWVSGRRTSLPSGSVDLSVWKSLSLWFSVWQRRRIVHNVKISGDVMDLLEKNRLPLELLVDGWYLSAAGFSHFVVLVYNPVICPDSSG